MLLCTVFMWRCAYCGMQSTVSTSPHEYSTQQHPSGMHSTVSTSPHEYSTQQHPSNLTDCNGL